MEILKRICFIGLLCTLLYSEDSQALFRTGYWWVSTYEMPTPSTNTGDIGILGAGMTFEWIPVPILGLGIESGLLLEPIMLNSNLNHHLVVPATLRYWISDRYSIGAGGFYASQLTNIPTNLVSNNYGWRFVAGINWPYNKERDESFAVDLSYQYSAQNLSRILGSTFSENQLVMQIGFRFGGGKSARHMHSRGVLPTLPYIIAEPPGPSSD